MAIKLWILIGSFLIFNSILIPTNAFILKPPLKKAFNTDKDISLNLNVKNKPNIDNNLTPTSLEITESTENLNIHIIDDNVHNNSLSSSKTIPDYNLTLIEEMNSDEAINKNEHDVITYSPATKNLENIIETNTEFHAEPLTLEASSLVRSLNEKIHKLEDINSEIEIHELGTGSDSLEDNIRNSVKEEISLDTALTQALEDIPEPEVRKALAEDVLDGLNQKNIINEEKIEENINMARNIYVDEKADEIEIPTISTSRSSAENFDNSNLTKMAKNLPDSTTISDIPKIDTEESTLINSPDDVELTQNLRLLIENEAISTTPDLIILNESTTTVPFQNLKITTISIEKDLDSRQSRGFDYVNVENSSPANSNDIHLENSYKSINIESLSHQAHKILNIEKTRSGRILTNNTESMINEQVIDENSERKNTTINEQNVKVQKNSNLDEIIDTTTMPNVNNVDTYSQNHQLNIENNNSEEIQNNIQELNYSRNLIDTSTIQDEKTVIENNFGDITTAKIEENIDTEKNIIEDEVIVENLTEKTILETQLPIQNALKINSQVDEIQGKNVVEQNGFESNENSLIKEKKVDDEIVKENIIIQVEQSSTTIQGETNSAEMITHRNILEENFNNSTVNSSSQSDNSESVENNTEEIILKTTITALPLELNSNSVETEIQDIHSEEKMIQGKFMPETATEIGNDWSEINENSIFNEEIIDHKEDLLSEGKKSYIDEQNINIVSQSEKNNTENHLIEENHVEISQNVENMRKLPQTESISQHEININPDEETTTTIPIVENMRNLPETESTSQPEIIINHDEEIATIISIVKNMKNLPEIESTSLPEMNIKQDEATTTETPINTESTTLQNLKSKQEITKTLNENILESENSAIENIESNNSNSSHNSERVLQIFSTTDSSSSSSEESTESLADNNVTTATVQINIIKDNKFSKSAEGQTTKSTKSSSSEESSEEETTKDHKVKKERIPLVTIYDILSGKITMKEHLDIENNSNSNLLKNVTAEGQTSDMSKLKDEKIDNGIIFFPNAIPPHVLDKKILIANNYNESGHKIFIHSDETEKIPALVFETTTILPLKNFNTTLKLEFLGDIRTFKSEEILKELENDTAALTETLIEAAELTTELSRHITSFRSIMEADTEILNETHETFTFPSSDTMATSNIGKALPNHGLKSDIIQNNASIVILICTLTIIMIIALLAVTLYRYRGKHGTLDIQLEEQRRGKDNNDDDDDDDSETMSSLNDNASSSATQSLKSNEKDITTNELSRLSKSNDELE